MDKKWVLKGKGDIVIVEQLANSLEIDNQLANLLVQRGIHAPDEARSFFAPDLSGLLASFTCLAQALFYF